MLVASFHNSCYNSVAGISPCFPSHPHQGLKMYCSWGRPLTRTQSSCTPHLQTCLSCKFTCPFQLWQTLHKNIPQHVQGKCRPPQVQHQYHTSSLLGPKPTASRRPKSVPRTLMAQTSKMFCSPPSFSQQRSIARTLSMAGQGTLPYMP